MSTRWVVGFVVALSAGAAGFAVSGAADEAAQIEVRFVLAQNWRAEVRAQFGGADAVGMAGYGASQFPRGWAQFVRDLRADDCAGNAVGLVADEKAARWRVERATARLCLSYAVDFEFASKPWPAGNEQAALRIDDALYTVSKAFVIAPLSVRDATVRLSAPVGFQIASPWPPAAEAGRYRVADFDRLVASTLVVSREGPVSVRVGDTEVLFHSLGARRDTLGEIRRTIGAIIPEHARVFGGKSPSRYMITMMPGEPDSEAFADSAGITTPYRQTRETVVDWGNELAHEFFHLWNGLALSASPTDAPQGRSAMEWFSEGFTEYYANRSLLRTGLVSPQTYWRMVERHFRNYYLFQNNPAFAGTSLIGAGANKGKYRQGVYDGGATLAFVLDVEIAAASGGRADLDDVMRRLFDRYAPGKKSFGLAEIVAILAEVAPGRDWKAFADAYVGGTETLPLAATMASLGFELRVQPYDGRAHLFVLPGADRRALEARTRYERGW